MLESQATAGTTVPAHKGSGGFPPFDTTTFPSQLFWLTITFAFLFVVLWRFAGPRIHGVIAARRDQINGDVAAAEENRRAAQQALAAYETALSAARGRANKMADENRGRINADVDKAKAAADSNAQGAMREAEDRIAASRAEARQHVLNAAQEAASDIVARLTGETVASDVAAAAVRSVSGG